MSVDNKCECGGTLEVRCDRCRVQVCSNKHCKNGRRFLEQDGKTGQNLLAVLCPMCEDVVIAHIKRSVKEVGLTLSGENDIDFTGKTWPQPTIIIQTGTYRYNHEGKAPRGRGLWGFSMMNDKEVLWVGSRDGKPVSGPDLNNDVTVFGILYSEAVTEAKRVARAKGATIIKVLP